MELKELGVLKSLLILMTCYLLILPSHATEPNGLWFGVEITDYSPYYYLDHKHRYQGAARDVFDLFANTLNIAATYEPMTVPRLFNEFFKGNVDLKFPDNPLWYASSKTEVDVFYSDPIFQVNESLLVLHEPPLEFGAQDIKQVGAISGFTLPGIAKHISNNEFEMINTQKVEQLIHMLVSKRVQGVYFNEDVALKLAKGMYPEQKLKRHPEFPAFKYAYHLSSIKHPNLIKKFNKFLNSHKSHIAKIKKRYGLK